MAHLIVALPVPPIQEQIVARRGVDFSKVVSTIDATVPLLKAKQLFTSELGFLTARREICCTPGEAQLHAPTRLTCSVSASFTSFSS